MCFTQSAIFNSLYFSRGNYLQITVYKIIKMAVSNT